MDNGVDDHFYNAEFNFNFAESRNSKLFRQQIRQTPSFLCRIRSPNSLPITYNVVIHWFQQIPVNAGLVGLPTFPISTTVPTLPSPPS